MQNFSQLFLGGIFMRRLLPFLAALTFSWGALAAQPPSVTYDEMITGIDTIKDIFISGYAMQDWKKSHLGVDVGSSFDQARAQITTDMTLNDFQLLVKKTLSDLNDYHVSVRFLKTESATLPFTVRSGEGRYFIAYIDRAQLSKVAFPFEVGDEVISFNGRPVVDEIADIRKITYGGVEETDQGMAELLLTLRAARAAVPVPQGPVAIKVKSAKTGAIHSQQLIWKYTAEEIQGPAVRLPMRDVADDKKIHFAKTQMTLGSFAKEDIVEENPFGLGSKKSFIPELGAKVWEAAETNHYNAYIFRSNSRLIGYVRIPHYMGDAEWIKDFAELIKKMEASTDALVIDEIDNPGGSVFYLYTLASLLTQEPLYTPKHQIKLTAKDVMEAVTLREQLKDVKTEEQAKAAFGDGMAGYPITLQFVEFVRNFAKFVSSEWSLGRTMTSPTFLYGVDKINPYPGTTYSKPILLMVNQLCFSGGDFFPSVMQDNERVTVMGVRTAGAGGYVQPYKYPNRLGIDQFSVTGSIAHRIKDEPIENLGVTPDVPYALTAKDFSTNFSDYKKAIITAVEALIK
jgi:hypothetical protein